MTCLHFHQFHGAAVSHFLILCLEVSDHGQKSRSSLDEIEQHEGSWGGGCEVDVVGFRVGGEVCEEASKISGALA